MENKKKKQENFRLLKAVLLIVKVTCKTHLDFIQLYDPQKITAKLYTLLRIAG